MYFGHPDPSWRPHLFQRQLHIFKYTQKAFIQYLKVNWILFIWGEYLFYSNQKWRFYSQPDDRSSTKKGFQRQVHPFKIFQESLLLENRWIEGSLLEFVIFYIRVGIDSFHFQVPPSHHQSKFWNELKSDWYVVNTRGSFHIGDVTSFYFSWIPIILNRQYKFLSFKTCVHFFNDKCWSYSINSGPNEFK